MSVLEHLEPKKVFYYFEEITGIPHGSRNTKQISDFCVDFAKKKNLRYIQDDNNNIIIFKDAYKGYENAEPVILQGHLDMVCEKTPDADIDMDKEGLTIGIDGDTIFAKDTTLGGDDGIAVAMMLAILDSDSIPHPPLEAVFTVDEEIGMLGAVSIQTDSLKGRRMLNMDSEEEGVLTVSCAGGNLAECILPLQRLPLTQTTYRITVGGLKGGHSGIEIDKGRANANVILGRFLQELKLQTDFLLISVNGGLKDNAIPRESKAVIAIQEKIDFISLAQSFEAKIRREYRSTDAEIFIQIQASKTESEEAMDRETTEKAIFMLTCLPNGIQRMSEEIEGLVETSLNMGIVRTTPKELSISFCVRSSVSSMKEMLNRRLLTMMEQIQGTMSVSGDYSAWEYRKDSPLRELMTDVFKEQYGKEPVIEAVHAGVECGIFAGKIPGLDCVSFGPNLTQIHTVRERMSISSVGRVYQYVLEVLKRMK